MPACFISSGNTIRSDRSLSDDAIDVVGCALRCWWDSSVLFGRAVGWCLRPLLANHI